MPLDPTLTTAIVNPAAAGGRVGREWSTIEPALRAHLGDIRFVFTERTGHGAELARNAVDAGATTLLAMGGDGTNNEVVNGIMGSGAPAGSITLGLLPAGTGGDFRRLLMHGDDAMSAAKALGEAVASPIDIGAVTYLSDAGATEERFFLNMVSFGLAGLVDRRVNRSSKRFGGLISFFAASLGALTEYRPARVKLTVDGEVKGEFEITNIAVCNGRFSGGGMMFAPHAKLNDGRLEVIVLKNGPIFQTVGVSRYLYSGKHLDHPLVSVFSGSSVVGETVTENRAWVDVDGEAPGTAPVSFRVVREALKLLDLKPEVL